MARNKREYSNTEVEVEQRPTIDLNKEIDLDAQRGPAVRSDRVISQELANELKFNEEPVTIELLKSGSADSAPWFGPVGVQGKPAEVWDEKLNRWIHYNGWLPTGVRITVKRKALENITRAKVERIYHRTIENPGQDPINQLGSEVIPVQGVTIIRDDNPAGRSWFESLAHRYA